MERALPRSPQKLHPSSSHHKVPNSRHCSLVATPAVSHQRLPVTSTRTMAPRPVSPGCQPLRKVARLRAEAAPADSVAAPPAAPVPGSLPPRPLVDPSELLETETDTRGLVRLTLKEEGYSTWSWQGHNVNYVGASPAKGFREVGPPLVLIHGFGASVYHWRYNLPELARHGRVFALDLLGFGWSDKALIQYNAGMWRQQVSDFVREVVGEPAILVGNSVGGYAALGTAAFYREQVLAVVLVNAAGKFKEDPAADTRGTGSSSSAGEQPDDMEVSFWRQLVEKVQTTIKRVGIYIAFQQARQPAKIQQVLETVYADGGSLDDDLRRSIVLPALQPNAAEVYYRLLTQVLFHSSNLAVNQLLDRIRNHEPGQQGSPEQRRRQSSNSMPLLLLWGELDPWCTPAIADKIQSYYPEAIRVGIRAGHCPHDEVPVAVNDALLTWWSSVGREAAGMNPKL